jgi:hypothetical protein
VTSAWQAIKDHRTEILRGARWGASLVWLLLFAHECYYEGLPFDREGLLLWVATGAAAFTLGRRALWTVIVDFLPFAAVLIAYDYLRGWADTLGMPTWWHPQVDIDKFLFFGHEPTVWLQEKLKYPDVRWWDVVVCLCYFSFFFLPYVTAGVLWVRRRADFHRWAARFVTLSFLGFALFALIPAAPPWAAARCTAQQVADHPANPQCIGWDGRYVPSGGILGRMTETRPGANAWVERISGKGWGELHLSVAQSLLSKGQGVVDQVAAIPSLHLGGTMLFVLFLWKRVKKWWWPVLAAYPVVMTFSLVYSAEHFVTDCLAGALLAVLVHWGIGRIERWRADRKAADTLERSDQTEASGASPCPTETTVSSTSASGAGSSSPPARSTAAPAPPGTTARSASS